MKTQFYQSPSGPLAYIDTGSNLQPMVFIHGFPTSKELFFPVIEQLKSEYRIIAIDLHNYGESGRTRSHRELGQRAAELVNFIVSLSLNKVILVGHHCGASLAVEMMRNNRFWIEKLVLMSSPVYPDFRIPATVKFFRMPGIGFICGALFKKSILNLSIKRGLMRKAQYTCSLKQTIQNAYRGMAGTQALLNEIRWGDPRVVFADYPSIMKKINVPTLIIHGKNDPYIAVEHAHRMNADIPGSKLVILENGSHFLPIDTPAEVIHSMRNFLRVEKNRIANKVSRGWTHLKPAVIAA